VETQEEVVTQLGGVFFLLDLLLALGLYADFTTPDEQGIGLDPWDCVTLLARALDPDADPHDPVWPLLARLAGRPPRVAAGCGWRPPDAWRIPRAWSAPFQAARPGTAPWRWSVRGGRLRVVHSTGFLVLDQAMHGPATPTDVRRALRGHGRVPRLERRQAARIEASAGSVPRRPVDRWIGRLAAYVRPRLALAFRSGEGTDIARLLIRVPAWVRVSAVDVEVAIALADLPIDVRLAGLDRDPGWMPAARRAVRFTFT
jgi:hypothetical protein